MYLTNGLSSGVQLHMRPVLISTTLLKESVLKIWVRRAATHVKRNVVASSHAVSGALRFLTKRPNRTVVTTKLLRGG